VAGLPCIYNGHPEIADTRVRLQLEGAACVNATKSTTTHDEPRYSEETMPQPETVRSPLLKTIRNKIMFRKNRDFTEKTLFSRNAILFWKVSMAPWKAEDRAN
jgi:hypothetical protein